MYDLLKIGFCNNLFYFKCLAQLKIRIALFCSRLYIFFRNYETLSSLFSLSLSSPLSFFFSFFFFYFLVFFFFIRECIFSPITSGCLVDAHKCQSSIIGPLIDIQARILWLSSRVLDFYGNPEHVSITWHSVSRLSAMWSVSTAMRSEYAIGSSAPWIVPFFINTLAIQDNRIYHVRISHYNFLWISLER